MTGHDVAYFLSFVPPTFFVLACAWVYANVERDKGFAYFLTAATTGIVFLLSMLFGLHTHTEDVPRDKVTFTTSPTTLYIEYGDMSMKTKNVYPYENYHDESKVNTVLVHGRSIYELSMGEELGLEITREGGTTNSLELSR